MNWIELAPKHKYGLPIRSPVMPAAGAFGFGEAYRDLVDYAQLGALVTNPVSLRKRTAAHGPRVGQHGDHFLIHTGLPNPGLKRVLRDHRRLWERLALPIILHLVGTTPGDVARACELLSTRRTVAGIELGLDDGTSVAEALALLEAARSGDLPIIVRVPFDGIERLAKPLAKAGADALTLTAPPRARLPGSPADEGRTSLRGRLYGPALLPLLLERLARWASQLPVPIIACGGIATVEEARACLDLGARALQLDALAWRDPEIYTLAAQLTASSS